MVEFESEPDTVTALPLASRERDAYRRCHQRLRNLDTSALRSARGVRIPFQRVRGPVGITSPLARGTVPELLRAGRFGARQNGAGTVCITGGYR